MSEITRDPLTATELQAFEIAFATLDIKCARPDIVKEKVKLTIEVAKAKLKAPFTGLYPQGNELGLGPLRPQHWGGSTTFATNYVTADAWNNYIINSMTTLEDYFACVWELEDTEAVARGQYMAWFLGPYTLPVIDLHGIRTNPYNRVPLPEPFFVNEKNNIDADIRVDSAGKCGIRPIGIVVTTGNNLTKKRPA